MVKTYVFSSVMLCMVMVFTSGEEGEYRLVTDEVYLDVSIGSQKSGRITIGLLGKDLPKTVANFMALANHTYGYGYRGSSFYSVQDSLYMMAGDIEYGNGSGGYSIYGKYFADEGFLVDHDGSGWVCMANQGRPDTNSAPFIIAMSSTINNDRSANLDGLNVGFGRVVKGMGIVNAINDVKVDANYRPKRDAIITDCGVAPLPVHKRYWLEMDTVLVTYPYDSSFEGKRLSNRASFHRGRLAITAVCLFMVCTA